MDRRNVIGLGLIFLLLYVWAYLNKPTPEQIEAWERKQDSLARVEQQTRMNTLEDYSDSVHSDSGIRQIPDDSAAVQVLKNRLGVFAANGAIGEKNYVLENSDLKLKFTNLGGRIISAELLHYKKVLRDSTGKDYKVPLFLLEDEKNKFGFDLLMADGRTIYSEEIPFEVEQNGNTLVFTANTVFGGKLQQIYSLAPKGYLVDYQIKMEGLDQVLRLPDNTLQLQWINYLDKLERNASYAKNYSTSYYKLKDEDPEHCSCTGNDEKNLDHRPIEWVSNTNQFFNSTLMASAGFKSAKLRTEILDKDSDDLKLLVNHLALPFEGLNNDQADMQWYIGPNDFELLASLDTELEFIIPYGRSILGSINRRLIRPLFDFLAGLTGSMGWSIILLTFIVKMLLYPFTYKMLHSQVKMSVLKPQIAKLKEKFGKDNQQLQLETMKLYREYGVSPLGGCLPMLAQMPIWFALYRFFPGNIGFRQEGFLWATDLSSYEEFIRLPFNIPMYGDHVSLFAILWALSVLWYSWYNMKFTDMTMQNPMMKYMQYLMPLSFIIFFNNFASGLTAYMLFSSILNIVQTVVTKKFVFDEDKILKELNLIKSKPKKTSAFRARLEEAMKQQQLAAQQQKRKK